jgi:mono/diheme cytochrome c family protein
MLVAYKDALASEDVDTLKSFLARYPGGRPALRVNEALRMLARKQRRPPPAMGKLAVFAAVGLILAAIVGAIAWKWQDISGTLSTPFESASSTQPQPAPPSPQRPPKSEDRVGPDTGNLNANRNLQTPAAVAQKVSLYEEDPQEPAQLFVSDCSACHKSPAGMAKGRSVSSLTSFLREHYTTNRESAAGLASYLASAGPGSARASPQAPTGKRFVGSVVWRTETVSRGANQPADVVVRADIEIPDRKMTMRWTLQRNAETSLPASHTVEVVFTLPPDFAHGGIQNVPGVLMKDSEKARGTLLAGLSVKVTDGYFLIGLSAVEPEMKQNLELLKGRPWLEVPIVYTDGRRAILAVEKGNPGDRAFNDAFAAWKQ